MKKKIIYIIGTGRSGSTLLDVALGNSKKCLSTGELYNSLYAIKNNKKCSCNKELSACEFWSEVNHELKDALSPFDINEMINIQYRFERSIFAPLRLFFGKIFSSKEFEKYKNFLEIFYKTIMKVSIKPVIVDSSKNPFRGYAMINIFPKNLYFIHLIRDGRGVMWSWFKTGKIPPFNITIKKLDSGKNHKDVLYWWAPLMYSISWIAYNLISSCVIHKAGSKHFIQINYENLLRNPSQNFNRIGQLLNLNIDDLKDQFFNKNPLRIDHLIAGNRLRMSKKLTVRLPDEAWKTQLSKKHQKIFWLLAGWLSILYGYKRY